MMRDDRSFDERTGEQRDDYGGHGTALCKPRWRRIDISCRAEKTCIFHDVVGVIAQYLDTNSEHAPVEVI